MIVFFNGQFLPQDEVRISPDDRGFLFADGAYEVVRVYAGQPFLMAEHLGRLRYSLGELRIALPQIEELHGVASELIRCNDLVRDEATIYIEVTRGVAPRAHAFPPEPVPPTRYVKVSPFRPAREKWDDGVAVITVPDIRWQRCDIKSLALLPNVLASQEAKERGVEEAILVREGVITEGAHTNVCMVLDGQLITHPATSRILAGITRGLVLDLCGQIGIPCRQEPIPAAALKAASELVILGTTTEIMPVVQVDGWQVGDGRPGPVTRELQRAFRATTEAVTTNLGSGVVEGDG
jgi:D-alanine transaminase